MIRTIIVGSGSYLPAKILTNQELASMVGGSEDFAGPTPWSRTVLAHGGHLRLAGGNAQLHL